MTDDDAEQRLLGRIEQNEAAAHAALTAAIKDPTVEGSMGQPQRNPLFAVAQRHDELAQELRRELAALRKRLKDDALLALARPS